MSGEQPLPEGVAVWRGDDERQTAAVVEHEHQIIAVLGVPVEQVGHAGAQLDSGEKGAAARRFRLARPEGDDLIVERDGARVVIDSVSVAYLAGSEIDFVDDLMGQSFRIRNPNATSSCGCGTSFSI